MDVSELKTPLKRVRGLGSAKDGTDHFWLQRVTAVSNLILVIVCLFIAVKLFGASYADAKAILSSPFAALAFLLLIVSGLIHMRLGMQVVIEDYISREGTKIVALIANTLFTVATGAACIFAILKISFGA